MSKLPSQVLGSFRADKEREDNFEESSDEDGFDMNELRHKMQINKRHPKEVRSWSKL